MHQRRSPANQPSSMRNQAWPTTHQPRSSAHHWGSNSNHCGSVSSHRGSCSARCAGDGERRGRDLFLCGSGRNQTGSRHKQLWRDGNQLGRSRRQFRRDRTQFWWHVFRPNPWAHRRFLPSLAFVASCACDFSARSTAASRLNGALDAGDAAAGDAAARPRSPRPGRHMPKSHGKAADKMRSARSIAPGTSAHQQRLNVALTRDTPRLGGSGNSAAPACISHGRRRDAVGTPQRRRSESNRRIADLQSAALPLGHGAGLQS